MNLFEGRIKGLEVRELGTLKRAEAPLVSFGRELQSEYDLFEDILAKIRFEPPLTRAQQHEQLRRVRTLR